MQLESQLITALLENKITEQEIRDKKFISDFMPILGDVFDWLLEYKKENDKYPSVDLIKTKSGVYQPVELTDNPLEILDALKGAHRGNYFEQCLVKAQRYYRKTGDLQKAKEYLEYKLTNIDMLDDEDVFEITSPDFILGEQDYEQRRLAREKQGYYGIPTGFGDELDGFLNGGWLKGNLYGLIGSTGVGKSWAAMAASRGGLHRGKRIFYLALEGTVAKEYYRFLTMIVGEGAENTRLQAGELGLDEFKFFQNQMREVAVASGGKVFLGIFGRKNQYTPKTLNARIEKFEPDLVIADYATLMTDGHSKEDWKSFMNVTKQGKIAAVKYNIPMLYILQGKIGQNGRVLLEDIAESKGMARDFDDLLGISKVPNKENIVRINNTKARDSEGDFDAFYQTGWNTGKVKFLEHVSVSDGDF